MSYRNIGKVVHIITSCASITKCFQGMMLLNLLISAFIGFVCVYVCVYIYLCVCVYISMCVYNINNIYVCVCVCLFVPSRHSGAVKAGVPAERDSCASLVSITSETPKSAICIDREQPHVTGCHKPLRKKTAVYFVATQKRCGEMDFTFYTWQSERERERERERAGGGRNGAAYLTPSEGT